MPSRSVDRLGSDWSRTRGRAQAHRPAAAMQAVRGAVVVVRLAGRVLVVACAAGSLSGASSRWRGQVLVVPRVVHPLSTGRLAA